MVEPKHLGVTDIDLWSPSKRDALFFDQIVVGNLEKSISKVENSVVRADWDYLASEGYVISSSYEMSERKGSLVLDGRPIVAVDLENPLSQVVEKTAAVGGLAALYAHYNQDRIPKLRELRSLTPALNVGSTVDQDIVSERALHLLKRLHAIQDRVGMNDVLSYAGPLLQKATIRSTTAKLSSLEQYTAVSIIPEPGEEGILLTNSTISDCFRLVLQSLPVPDELTPWEEILEFRRDEYTRTQIGRFRRWIRNAFRRLANESVTLDELQDELAENIENYAEHMRVNKLKTSASSVETLVITSAEIVESIVKLNFSTLAKGLFKVRHQQIALMEAELKAPGRELAYVVAARDRFKS